MVYAVETMTGPNETELAASIAEQLGCGSWRYEVPYNHYGDRGVVDLVREIEYEGGGGGELRVFELKSESALNEVTGANEILRQFNRHREYFIDGTDYNPADWNSITFELTFAATPACIEHLKENWSIYNTVHKDRRKSTSTIEIDSRVFCRSTEYSTPVIYQDGDFLPNSAARGLGLVEVDQ